MSASNAPPYIVSTDLDGTLLDHFSYSWQAAIPSIKKLEQMSVPIIINTSKTFAEVEKLQNILEFNAPFIVENGSAVYIPKALIYAKKYEHFNTKFNRLVLGIHQENITLLLHQLRKKNGWRFEGYSDWSVDDIITHTSLSRPDAENSKKRQFSEPIIWQDSEENFLVFKQEIEKKHYRIIKGGRFIHILGESDKGKALTALTQMMACAPPPKLICLGDSHNDLDMLNIADIPVFVRSPAHDFPEHACTNTPIYTHAYGPEGWHEAISHILS